MRFGKKVQGSPKSWRKVFVCKIEERAGKTHRCASSSAAAGSSIRAGHPGSIQQMRLHPHGSFHSRGLHSGLMKSIYPPLPEPLTLNALSAPTTTRMCAFHRPPCKDGSRRDEIEAHPEQLYPSERLACTASMNGRYWLLLVMS